MTLTTTLQEIEKEILDIPAFDKEQDQILVLRSYVQSLPKRLLESLKEELPGVASEELLKDRYEFACGFDTYRSTIHQLLDNAIKSIEV